MKTALLITTDEKFQEIEFENSLEFFYKHIGCDLIKITNPRALRKLADLSDSFIMVVDEERLLRDNPKLNIYGSTFRGMPIYGNVMIVKEVMTNDGLDFDGLTREDHEELSAAIVKLLGQLEKQYHN